MQSTCVIAKKFMDEDFLLSNETAKYLYHNHAKNMPIFDYHCHLIPSQIAEDKRYNNITEIWLYGDHYKWRAMRSFGVDEEYITKTNDTNYKVGERLVINEKDAKEFTKLVEKVGSSILNIKLD